MISSLFAWGLLSAVLVIAVWHDMATRRIPNRLVLLGVLTGVACNLFAPRGAGLFLDGGGGVGVGNALLGMLTGGALLLPAYLLHALGAGDVKLMAAIGAFLGLPQVLGAVLLSFLAGGVLSLAVAVVSRSVPRVIDNLRLISISIMAKQSGGLRVTDIPTTGRLPYAIAIFCGTVLQIWLCNNFAWPFL